MYEPGVVTVVGSKTSTDGAPDPLNAWTKSGTTGPNTQIQTVVSSKPDLPILFHLRSPDLPTQKGMIHPKNQFKVPTETGQLYCSQMTSTHYMTGKQQGCGR